MATGARRWVLRVRVHGKRRDFGLGSFSIVSLKEARDRAMDLRRRIEAGQEIKPVERETKTARRKAVRMALAKARPDDTVVMPREAFREFWRIKKPQLHNPKHAAQ